MTDLALERSVPAQRATANWIVSPAFDLFLLILVPLLTVPIVAGYYLGYRTLAVAAVITLSFAHYCSSFVFYFWDENKAYHRQRWLAFFAGPLILAAIYSSLLLVPAGALVLASALFFWNTFHVARQNCGILSIYRHRAGVTDIEQKRVANRAIIAASLFLSLWNIDTHREVAALFGLAPLDWARLLRIGAGVVAAIAIVDLARVVWKRSVHSESPRAPEALFLLASVGFFFPFLIFRTSEMATLAMLLPHYVQYMAIVWLVHRRKFGGGTSGAGAALRKLSGSLVWLLPALLITGVSFYLVLELMTRVGRQSLALTLFVLIAFEHFYLDGLIWSFKQAHVRRTIAPALLSPRP
jgi:hypothetical protein